MASGTCYHAGGCWPSQEQSGGKLRLGELSKQAGVGSKAHSTTLPRGSLGKEAGWGGKSAAARRGSHRRAWAFVFSGK